MHSIGAFRILGGEDSYQVRPPKRTELPGDQVFHPMPDATMAANITNV